MRSGRVVRIFQRLPTTDSRWVRQQEDLTDLKKTMGRGAPPKRGTRGETTKNKACLPPVAAGPRPLEGQDHDREAAHAMIRSGRRRCCASARMVESDGTSGRAGGRPGVHDHIGAKPDLEELAGASGRGRAHDDGAPRPRSSFGRRSRQEWDEGRSRDGEGSLPHAAAALLRVRPCEGHGKDELLEPREELRKQRQELAEQREGTRALATAVICPAGRPRQLHPDAGGSISFEDGDCRLWPCPRSAPELRRRVLLHVGRRGAAPGRRSPLF
jgi:hypothetical protein